MNPRARTQDIDTHWLGDELIVYDLRSHEVHSLPTFVARVWESADGTRSVSDLTKLITGPDLEIDSAKLSEALIQLAGADLMEGIKPGGSTSGQNRAA
jgi:hypothetical protein